MYGDFFTRQQVSAGIQVLVEGAPGKRQVYILLFRTHVVLNVIANFIRFESFVIEPYMPSTSAKINYLLGLGERTEHDAVLGKAFNTGNFKEVFLGLTAKS